MAANGKINSALCPNNWVRKLHGNRNARCHFCISDDVAATEVCENCVLHTGQACACTTYVNFLRGARDLCVLHTGHIVIPPYE